VKNAVERKGMMTKTNSRHSVSQAQGLRGMLSSFILHPSSLPFPLSSFSLHTSSFRLSPSSLRMLFRNSRKAFAGACLLVSAFCLLPTLLHAQGCAMCYNAASAANSGAKEALANGVLILLVPPMVFFALIAVVVYRYRNKFRELSVVRSQLFVARSPSDGESWRSDEPSAEAPDLDSWSPGHPIIGSPDSLPRATDN
jgi:hypothetical protein